MENNTYFVYMQKRDLTNGFDYPPYFPDSVMSNIIMSTFLPDSVMKLEKVQTVQRTIT